MRAVFIFSIMLLISCQAPTTQETLISYDLPFVKKEKTEISDASEWLINVATTRNTDGNRYADFVINKEGTAFISSFEIEKNKNENAIIFEVRADGKRVEQHQIGKGQNYAISQVGDELVFGGQVSLNSPTGIQRELGFKSDFTLKNKTALKGFGNGTVYNLASNQANEVFLSGEFNNFVGFDDKQVSINGKGAFIAILDTNNHCQWIKAITGNLKISQTICDGKGNLWLVGAFQGTINIDKQTFSTNESLDTDAFIFKFNRNGTLIFHNIFGSIGSQPNNYYTHNVATSITTDYDGNIHIVGIIDGEAIIDENIFGQKLYKSIFHTKIDLSTNEISKFSLLGESQENISIFSMAIDKNENIYIAGTTESGKIGAQKIRKQTSSTTFITKFDRKKEFLWLKRCEKTDTTALFLVLKGDFLWVSGHYKQEITFENRKIKNNGEDGLFLMKIRT